MLKAVRCAVLSVVATSFVPIVISAQQAPPSADTFVNSATPTMNYGSTIFLAVGPGTTSYLKFNLGTVPARSTVSKATLRLYVDAVVSGGQFNVYNLPSSPAWNERTLNFSSPPPPLGSSATGGHPISVTSASMNTFVLIDLTSTVQEWLADPTSNNGLAIGDVGGTGWFSFDSKESFLTAHQPELEIAINAPGGPQGPQGMQGPQGLQGVAGPAGPAGSQGPKGDTGLTGATGMIGPIGPQGLTGNTGLQGLMGLPGPAGLAGTNGIGFNFRSAFDASASYAINDVATFNGASYVATAANTGPSNPTPDTNAATWALMAAQGAVGPAGATGSAGPQGSAGPAGPAGPTSLMSINSLNGLACSLGGQPGTIVLSFGSNGVTTMTCTLPIAKLTVINVAPSSAFAYAGTTQQFTATGLYTDGSTKDITASANWNSSIIQAATIGNTGLATAVAPGSTTLSAAQDGVTGTAILKVPALVSDGINNSFVSPVSLGSFICGGFSSRSGSTFPAGTEDWLVLTLSTPFGCNKGTVTLTASRGIQFDVLTSPTVYVALSSSGSVTLPAPGTYYIRIYGATPLATGTWTIQASMQ